jgi:hypothetical protein
VLFAAGIDVDKELPWIRPWFLKYQLSDGGLNCDDAACRKTDPKSSIVSTLPPLEAVLLCTSRAFTDEELQFLDRGADYLISHKLFRRKSNGEVIDSTWLEARFPRFYDYDVLRGFSFLSKWARMRGRAIPESLVHEVKLLVAKQMTPEGAVLQRFNAVDSRSYNPNDDGTWTWGTASSFKLRDAIEASTGINPFLTRQWIEARTFEGRGL